MHILFLKISNIVNFIMKKKNIINIFLSLNKENKYKFNFLYKIKFPLKFEFINLLFRYTN